MSKDFIIHVDTVKHAPKEHRPERHSVPKPKQKPMLVHKKHGLKPFIILLIIIIAAGVLFYITQIDRSFVTKPNLQKPEIPDTVEEYKVDEEELDYLFNEVGGYKLQSIPFSDNIPEMEVIVTDTERVFTIKTIDGKMESAEGEAENPDLRISAEKAVIYEVLSSEDVNQALVNKYEQGELELELLKSENELILKGYKGIYDALNV